MQGGDANNDTDTGNHCVAALAAAIVPQSTPSAEAAGKWKTKNSSPSTPYVGRFGFKTLDVSGPYRRGGDERAKWAEVCPYEFCDVRVGIALPF